MILARQSVLEPFAGASPFAHSGQRVVVGQRLMQAASDLFLGWYTASAGTKNQYYARQLRDAKIKPVVEIMKPANLKGPPGFAGRPSRGRKRALAMRLCWRGIWGITPLSKMP